MKYASNASIRFVLLILAILFIAPINGDDNKFPSSAVPACIPLSRLQGPYSSQNPPSQRIVVVGDVHGEYKGLREVLFHSHILQSVDACEWNHDTTGTILIQMGDVVDRGSFAIESFKCLENLQTTAFARGNTVVRLLGNHELWWLEGSIHMRNKDTDTPENIAYIVSKLKEGITSGLVHGSYPLWVHGIPILLSHAGLRPSMIQFIEKSIKDITPMQDQMKLMTVPISGGDGRGFGIDALSAHINRRVQEVVSLCQGYKKCKFDGPLFQAGPDRGDNVNIGGPFWTDFKVLQQTAITATAPPAFVQIVGHSIELNHVRATASMAAIGVDAGMFIGGRAYLEISPDGHFRAYEKDKSSSLKNMWKMKDLTSLECS